MIDINEHKRTEGALRRSEERLQQFVNQSPAALAMFDREMRYIAVSKRWIKDYSLGNRDFIGVSHYEIFPEIQENRKNAHRRGLAGETVVSEEDSFLRLDGTVQWINWEVHPWRSVEGNIGGIVIYSEDITRYKQVEEDIRWMNSALERVVEHRTAQLTSEMEASKKYQHELMQYVAIIESSDDAIISISLEGFIMSWNGGAERIFGYTAEEVLSRPIHILIPEHFQLEERNLLEKIRDGETVRHYETVRKCKDGKQIDISVTLSPIRDQAGDIVAASKVARDISRSKQLETELRIAAFAFESQEGMLVTDNKGVIQRVNRAFTKITGYTSEEVVGQTSRILKSGRHDADFYRAMWETIKCTGAWKGEIWDRRKNGEIYPKWLTITAVKDENGCVTHYVGSHIDITERKAAENEVKNLAFYDPLTRLPNRRLLLDRLDHALSTSARSEREGALMFIDLDNFKTINDTLGHNIGDLLLQQVAKRLESCVREGDTVARLGGDEFVVMLENLSKEGLEAATQAEVIGEKILSTLNQPYLLGTHEQRNSPSIGITLFNDQHQIPEDLFKQADMAMYQSKKAGRNTLRFFDPQMQESINARSTLEFELHKAIENKELQLYYQVQIDSSHHPIGTEALIRWIHPERGLVPPIQFIPFAEESELIISIGNWVLETACAQLKAWQENELTCNLMLSINVSAKQFRQRNFVTAVQAAIQKHRFNPNLLKLELTESMLLDKIEETIATMKMLKTIGVQISLDDFGTGYSSLQYLKRLPLNQLKIDQSFVRDIALDESDKAIVRTIIILAQSLNLNVIAEGVETDEQRQFLESVGCGHYQGYLYGKPIPIEQFEVLLKQF